MAYISDQMKSKLIGHPVPKYSRFISSISQCFADDVKSCPKL